MGLSCPISSLIKLMRSLKGYWTSFILLLLATFCNDVQSTRPHVAYALRIANRYQTCAGEAHWTVIKTLHRYLRKTNDIFLIYDDEKLILEGYNNASFQSYDHDAKSQLGSIFKLNGGVVAWKSSKQENTTDSTT
ncbi:UNVERIFIED_CONTAM: hypothetical protein Sradi_3560600 [Sesamum radiatum]|uniref:Retrotransposon protein, putative, Ty1-copia subclass n=1 Tax=Sesamum radiatum TaxID=300843 RepID=A0AAW2QG11_SESRA